VKYLHAYINELFPSVFRSESYKKRLFDEICKHHRYIILFRPAEGGSNADNVRMLTGLQLLTVQTMLMFMVAVCYDVQFPTDDGSCTTFSAESACLARKSIFDTRVSYCSWKWDREIDEYACEYAPPQLMFTTLMVICVVVAIFTAPVNTLVDFLFIDVLSAPTADLLKVQAEDTAIKKAFRRASNAAVTAGHNVRKASVATLNALRHRVVPLTQKSSKSAGFFSVDIQKTRIVPESTANAYVLASASSVEIVRRASNAIADASRKKTMARKSSDVLRRRTRLDAERSRQREREDKDKSFAVQRRNNLERSIADKTVDERFVDLSVDISAQRRILKRTQKESFDNSWGIDPTGEYYRRSSYISFCTFGFIRPLSVEDLIKDELTFVREESRDKIAKLRVASDV
jgi:hypothetical protein